MGQSQFLCWHRINQVNRVNWKGFPTVAITRMTSTCPRMRTQTLPPGVEGRPTSNPPCRPRSKPAQGSQCLLPTTLPGIQQSQFQSPCPSLEMCVTWMLRPFHLLSHLMFTGGITSHTRARGTWRCRPCSESLKTSFPPPSRLSPKFKTNSWTLHNLSGFFPTPGYSLALWHLIQACLPSPGLPPCLSLPLNTFFPPPLPLYIHAEAGLCQDAFPSPRLQQPLESLTPTTACSPTL